MFRFIKKIFVPAMSLFGCNVLKCVSKNNRECKARPKIINNNSNKPSFYPYSVKISNNNINDPYAKFCVPDVGKNMNVKCLI